MTFSDGVQLRSVGRVAFSDVGSWPCVSAALQFFSRDAAPFFRGRLSCGGRLRLLLSRLVRSRCLTLLFRPGFLFSSRGFSVSLPRRLFLGTQLPGFSLLLLSILLAAGSPSFLPFVVRLPCSAFAAFWPSVGVSPVSSLSAALTRFWSLNTALFSTSSGWSLYPAYWSCCLVGAWPLFSFFLHAFWARSLSASVFLSIALSLWGAFC